MKTLTDLAKNLEKEFNKTKDLKYCQKFLEDYDGEDWKNYFPCQKCQKCQLTKNTYRRMPIKIPYLHNKPYDMYLLIWNPRVESPIHDHPENGCLLKILKGSLIEEKYTKDGNLINRIIMENDNVSYMHDSIGYHKIINNSEEITYSLHIYSPVKYIPHAYQLDDLINC